MRRAILGLVQRLQDDSGYVLATAYLLPALVMMVGISFDLGIALQTRREVANIAMESARFGATFIDEDEFRWNSTLIITEEGRQAATNFAAQAGADGASATLGKARFATGRTTRVLRDSTARIASRRYADEAVYTESGYIEVTVTKPVTYVFIARFLPASIAEASAQALAVDLLQGCGGEAESCSS